MDVLLGLITGLLPLSYALLTAGYAVVFFRDEPVLARILPRFLGGTLAVHVLYVALRIVRFEHVPLATVFESLTTVALGLGLVYWFIERNVRTQATGWFALGIATLAQIASSAFIGHSGTYNELFRSPLFGAHTISAAFGLVGFALSAVYGVLYLMLHHELKVSRFGIIYERLPSLDTLASMHDRAATVGLFMLTIAILLGVMWMPNVPDKYGMELADPKVVFTAAVWLLYAAVVLARRYGWGDSVRLVSISIFGFVFLVCSTIAVNLWFSSFHAFT